MNDPTDAGHFPAAPGGRGSIPALSLLLAAASVLPALGAGALSPSQSPGPPFKKGSTSRVICSADPGQAYALYVPSSYSPSRPAPILFLLDARGRAGIPLERFRAGAERYGFILASSYNSASDTEGATDPNRAALGAMWKDAAARLSVDAARVYVGGFSGTARAACDLALAAPGEIAGVVAAGAGFASGHLPSRGSSFALFGTVGEADFNYYEMMDLDDRLGSLDIPHRIEVFPGGHEWMPADLATAALEWLEVRADSAVPLAHAGFLEGAWSRGFEEARSLEAEGRRLEALRAYRSLGREFSGLRDVREAAEAARRLEASEETRREQRQWEERRDRETQALEAAWRVLGDAVRSPGPVRLAKLLGDLNLSEWRRKAAEEGEDAAAARRVLAAIRVQTGFYLPREEAARGNQRAVALLLSVASAVAPQDAALAYRLAVAQAGAGNRKDALRALDLALEDGFGDLEMMKNEQAFDGIRKTSRYRKIEEEMARRRGKSAPGKSTPSSGGF